MAFLKFSYVLVNIIIYFIISHNQTGVANITQFRLSYLSGSAVGTYLMVSMYSLSSISIMAQNIQQVAPLDD